MHTDKSSAPGLITGGLVGIVLGSIVGLISGIARDDSRDTIKVFKEEGKPIVIREDRNFASDSIFIETPEKNGYIPLSKYLDGIENKYDRIIEEARIKKQVDW